MNSHLLPETKEPLMDLANAGMLSLDSNANEFVEGKFRKMKCRARGVSEDHDAGQGFFLVPEGMAHGAPLICSFSECGAEKRRRFQYCKYCDAPATSRNFKHRHGHKEGKTAVEGGGPSRKKARAQGAEGILEEKDQKTAFTVHASAEKRQAAFPSNKLKADRMKSGPYPMPDIPSKEEASSKKGGKKLVELDQRELTWLDLLRNRPNTHDNEGMHGWMEQILQISEPLNPDPIPSQHLPPEPWEGGANAYATGGYESG
jgi:hypothetical protein